MIKRAVLAFATFALIAGCGSEEGGGGDGDPLAMLAQAARKSSETESYRFEMMMSTDGGSEAMRMDASGTSNADSTESKMSGTMNFGEGNKSFEAIVTDGRMYMAGEAVELPRGKWIDTEDDAPVQTLSPSEFVKFLQESGDVELVGTETIRGEEAQHFRGPVDMKELIEQSPDSALAEQMKNNPAVEDLDVVLDIWVADSGLPSRIAVEMTAPGQDGSVKMAADVLEYDVPVKAEAPPESDIVHLGDLGG